MDTGTDKQWSQTVLGQAKELVALLESGKHDDAKALLDTMRGERDVTLFSEIGKLTRQLHEALISFQLDNKISAFAAHDIPDARQRLNYVITMTEQAANKTMDGLERVLPMVSDLNHQASEFRGKMQKLLRKEMQPGEFRMLCDDLVAHFERTEGQLADVNHTLNDIILAQDYQDLTGQVIRRVINLVQEVESSLVDLVKMFGNMNEFNTAKVEPAKPVSGVEGPVVDKTRQDVVHGQDDVDALLSSLGF
ncbi:MAG: protein phosphatase CheZ [Pseudomonadota bacterium]